MSPIPAAAKSQICFNHSSYALLKTAGLPSPLFLNSIEGFYRQKDFFFPLNSSINVIRICLYPFIFVIALSLSSHGFCLPAIFTHSGPIPFSRLSFARWNEPSSQITATLLRSLFQCDFSFPEHSCPSLYAAV